MEGGRGEGMEGEGGRMREWRGREGWGRTGIGWRVRESVKGKEGEGRVQESRPTDQR